MKSLWRNKMGRVKAMLMSEEDKFNEFVWTICGECESFKEFQDKVNKYSKENNIIHNVYADGTTTRGSLKDVWYEYWSKYNVNKNV